MKDSYKPKLRYKDHPKVARRNPAVHTPEAQELARVYTDAHWGAKPTKFLHVSDPLVPDVVAMGRLDMLEGPKFGAIQFPKGCWLAWNPKHPRHRLYVILTAGMREKFRKLAKQVMPSETEYLQAIAERARGDQCNFKLPNVKAIDLGPCAVVNYTTLKIGDGWSGYTHAFGHEGRKGIVPHLAIDVSGRCVLAGGAYRVVDAGVVG